jgi:hypothetical protein
MRVLAAAITLADRERFIVSWFMAYRQTSESKDFFDIVVSTVRLLGQCATGAGAASLILRSASARRRGGTHDQHEDPSPTICLMQWPPGEAAPCCRQRLTGVALSKTSASCQPDIGSTGSIVLDEEWQSACSHALAAASMPACI